MSHDGPAFALRVRQNPFLALGGTAMHAVIEIRAEEVRAADAAGRPVVPSAAEVIMIDTSSSMSGPKVAAAARAAAAAVDVLRDGAAFAVIAGESSARMIYPGQAALATASAQTRRAAKAALAEVTANGGTSMSTWLRLADRLFAGSDARIKHALMLTDGQNVEGDAPLEAALADCAGHFSCDSRGVGDDWQPDQLKLISAALHGAWKPIAKPEELEADFREVTAASMRKRVADVALRIRKPPASKLVHIHRVFPDIEDLMPHVAPSSDGRALDIPLGAWAPGEERAYHVRFSVSQQELGIEDEGLASAGFVQVLARRPDGETAATPRVSVQTVWTRNNANALIIHPVVAQYTGQQELAAEVRTAIEAYGRHEPDAEAKMGVVVARAYALQRQDILEQIAQIVSIKDLERGVVEIKPTPVAPSDFFKLDRLSTQTVWSKDEVEGGDR